MVMKDSVKTIFIFIHPERNLGCYQIFSGKFQILVFVEINMYCILLAGAGWGYGYKKQ